MELVGPLGSAFNAAGHRLFLVGGVVRDLALGAHGAGDDIDLTTDAEPSAIKDLVRPTATAVWAQGERFGTIGAEIAGRALEITTHRVEAYDHSSRNPVVRYGTDVADDLTRRDFTINAMAIEVPNGELIDPFDGQSDLATRQLVTPLSPEESFSDDPLRMLRAARFIPRFDLTPDHALVAAARDLAERLRIVSVERVHDEFERLLAISDPTPGLDFLTETGLHTEIIPAYTGQAEAWDRASARLMVPASPLVRRAALLEPLGLADAEASLVRLRYPKAAMRATLSILGVVPVARSPIGTRAVDPAVVRRVVADVGVGLVDDAVALARLASVRGLSTAEPFAARLEELRATEDLTELGSPLSGAAIIDLLGVEPGPVVGEASRVLAEQRIEQGPLDEATASALLRSWWASRA